MVKPKLEEVFFVNCDGCGERYCLAREEAEPHLTEEFKVILAKKLAKGALTVVLKFSEQTGCPRCSLEMPKAEDISEIFHSPYPS